MALRRSLIRLAPLAGFCVFGFAVFLIHREITAAKYYDLIAVLNHIPKLRVGMALLLVLISYLALTGYDALGLRYTGTRLGFPKIALTSFISHVFSNNIGFGAVTGGLLRYRLYSLFGIDALDAAKISAFCIASFWTGLTLIGGLALVLEPIPVPNFAGGIHLPAKGIGFILLGAFAAYVAAAFLLKKPVTLGSLSLAMPKPRLVFGQAAISSLDWLAAVAALFVLLPEQAGVAFTHLLAVFMLAQVLGVVSNVPGGLGVFEATVLFCLPYGIPKAEMFGYLLAFRFLYYLVPLSGASLLFGGFELYLRRARVKRSLSWVRQITEPVMPIAVALSVFLSGALLLLSGSTPGLPHRLEWLNGLLPLAAIEGSHFLASLAGTGLLLLARGLQLRLEGAYYLTMGLLGSAMVFSVLKGLDYEEAVLLAGVFAFLALGRRHFYRHASIREQPFTPGWIAAIGIVISASLWIGFFCYRHVEYGPDLWWNFVLHGNASRFLRASFGVAAGLTIYAGWKLLLPSKPGFLGKAPTEEDLITAQAIARIHSRTYAYLALLGDKSLLFSERRNAFLMFRGEGRSLVSMGDPVGPDEEIRELVWRFKAICDRQGAHPVFYQVAPDRLPLYIDAGLSFLKLGEEACIPLKGFSLDNKEFKNLRGSYRRVEKEGVTFEILAPGLAAENMASLAAVSESWLRSKKAREKGFSLGFFNPEYLSRLPVAVARQQGRIVAFTNIWLGGGHDELSIDLMRYSDQAPNGVMDFLFANMLLFGKAEGFRWFNIGMAPLSGIESRRYASLWNKMGGFFFEHGERFYNFQGLRHYKEKFHPIWEPRYLASPGGFALPRILGNLATLISGGMRGMISK